MAIECINCRVSPGTTEFGGVIVCASCKAVAERTYSKLQEELQCLLSLARESIRLHLIEGRLQFPEAGEAKELSKKDLLEAILSLPNPRGVKDGRK